MSAPWLLESLPPALRAALVHGSEGAGHLIGCADMAAQAGLPVLAGQLAVAAWMESPLDANLAVRALKALEAVGAATGPLAALAGHVRTATRPPADLTFYRRLAERRDNHKIRRYLADQARKDAGNLFWDRLALTHSLDAEDWDWTAEVVTRLPVPLGGLLEGDAAMMRGELDAAMAGYARLSRALGAPEAGDAESGDLLADASGPERRDIPRNPPSPASQAIGGSLGSMDDSISGSPGQACLDIRLGLARLAAGDGDGATQLLRMGIRREPWRTQALLSLHDLVRRRRRLTRPLDDRIDILLYTWNKAADIDRTLRSLHDSDLGPARLTVLDNGSTDETPEVLAGWRGRFGPERLDVVTLPVNVGAPAARNWLMNRVKTRGPRFVVFLDDDASLPADWLGLLGAARELYPQAGVWGARVKDFSRPAHVQSADVFLAPEPEDMSMTAGTRRFTLSSCHHQTLDRGQFAYLRPCATVTGCCHLFEAETLFGLGGFDLRYSPSQYDDLDHDVRLLLSGRTPVYQGHLSVGHFKSTGSLGGEGQAQYGIGFANQYKLHQKFTAEEFRQASDLADGVAWEDLLAKWRELDA